jgi:hypothetical protein
MLLVAALLAAAPLRAQRNAPPPAPPDPGAERRSAIGIAAARIAPSVVEYLRVNRGAIRMYLERDRQLTYPDYWANR